MKKKLAPLAEDIGEATTACLITMTQGNFLALGLTHWIIASQTGIVAGLAASAALFMTKTDNRWIIAVVLGVVTAVVDYLMHPGMIGPVFLEAIITGIGAGVLSYGVGWFLQYRRRRQASRASI
ncbi:MAG: hypothetical protein ACR2QR_06855 [Woeseiaceae bacterium]